jgi:hypothetical protein
LAVFIVALILASAASNTRGALSATLWILAAASLAIAIYTRTPYGRTALAHRAAKAKSAAESKHSDKQRLTKPKPPKLLPLRQQKEDQGMPHESKSNLKPKTRTRDR